MSSEERSSSAVRNLRSIFENKNNDAADNIRGRSPGVDQERPRSKVRTSFFPVESPKPQQSTSNMASAPDFSNTPNAMAPIQREPSTGRRTSFSEDQGSLAVEAIKGSVAQEAERRRESKIVAETIPEAAIESPLVEKKKQLGDKPGVKKDVEAENPDKPVTGAEEEPADMKPAQPTSEQAVSGGEALPPVAEDLRKPATSKPKTSTVKAAAKPAPVSAKSAPRASMSSAKSLRTASTTSTSSGAARPSRASLTAPTAASVARAAASDKATATTTKQSTAAPKPKPRETTKPVEVSSRLTAPTAASRAKHEAAPAAPTSKPAATSRPKPTGSARPSLGRPESRSSQTTMTKSTKPVDSSFLERMSRPTAAVANRLRGNDKPEVGSPPSKSNKLPIRPKTNGRPNPPKATDSAQVTDAEEPAIEEPVVQEGIEDQTQQAEEMPAMNAESAEMEAAEIKNAAETAREAGADVSAQAGLTEEGNATPNTHTNGHTAESAMALEDTPAGITDHTRIR